MFEVLYPAIILRICFSISYVGLYFYDMRSISCNLYLNMLMVYGTEMLKMFISLKYL